MHELLLAFLEVRLIERELQLPIEQVNVISITMDDQGAPPTSNKGMYLPSFPEFTGHDSATAALDWEKYIKRLERLFCAISVTDSKKKRDLLLYYVGDDVNDIFANLENTGNDYDTAKTKLHEHFNPKRNVDYHRCKFGDTTQLPDESIADFYVRLQKLAGYCDFADKEGNIKTQLLRGTCSSALRRKALRDNLTLKQIIDTGRAAEITRDQTSDLEKTAQVNYTGGRFKSGRSGHKYAKNKPQMQPQAASAKPTAKQSKPKRGHSDAKRTDAPAKSCFRCGGPWPHAQKCPALGKRCFKCGRENHVAKACQNSGTVNQVSQNVKSGEINKNNESQVYPNLDGSSESESSDVGYTFGLSDKTKSPLPSVNVAFGNRTVQTYVDSCSTVTLLNKSELEQWTSPPELTKPKKVIYPYGSTEPIPLVGMFTCTIAHNGQCVQDEVYVSQSGVSLLSFETSQALGLVQITCGIQTKVDHIVDNFDDRFTGIGKLNNKAAKLHIDDQIMPVIQPHRRIPFHLRKKLTAELTKLQDLDIIEPVGDSPTPWVSPVHVVNKPNSLGQIRMCVDMRMANQAIAGEALDTNNG